MDNLSVFINTTLSWNNLIDCLKKISNIEGEDCSDELGKRHVWNCFHFELIAINKPMLEDDQGIPFARYNFQLKLVASDIKDPAEVNLFCFALARYLVIRLQEKIEGEIVLIKNLQSVVPVK